MIKTILSPLTLGMWAINTWLPLGGRPRHYANFLIDIIFKIQYFEIG